MKKEHDLDFENALSKGSGRKSNQRMKAYLIMQYLLQNSDEEHPVKIDDITGYLQDVCGIYAERRSVYKDIKEINVVHLMLQDGCTFDEAKDELSDDDSLALIQYKHLHGFYVKDQNRSVSPLEARLLAECIYSSKFIPKGREQQYIDMVCSSLSSYQRERVNHEVFLLDRVSTLNRYTLQNIDTIKETLPPNEPQKLKFYYLKYTLQNSAPKLTDRRGGKEYTVSPYAMLIDNGYYYLLAIDERYKEKKLRTFRIDRMRSVKILSEPRTVTEETKELDLQDYTRRVFSMYGGKRERVTIRFVKSLLDVAVDRFWTQDVIYSQMDDDHIAVTVSVEISDQFFGWLCGFRHKVKITAPDWVVNDFSKYVKSLSDWYQS